MQNTEQTITIFGLSLLMEGTFLLIAIFLWHRTRRFIEQSHVTSGVIINMVRRSSSRSKRTLAPVVRFTAHDGQIVEFTEQTGSYPPRHKVGDQVRVRYHQQRFTQARVASTDRELYWVAQLAGALGLIFLASTCLLGGVAYLAFRLLGTPG